MILLNNTTLNKQPSEVTEQIIPIQTDVTAIDGSVQRNWIQNKYAAICKWSYLYPADYQQIMAIITGSGIINYYNNLSDEAAGGILQFNALCTFKETPYAPGASVIRDLEVTFRSI